MRRSTESTASLWKASLIGGYARNLTEEEAARQSGKTWYLPHHGVIHPQRKDKIRVVFDAAAIHNGASLNNQLQQGPDLTNTLSGCFAEV